MGSSRKAKARRKSVHTKVRVGLKKPVKPPRAVVLPGTEQECVPTPAPPGLRVRLPTSDRRRVLLPCGSGRRGRKRRRLTQTTRRWAWRWTPTARTGAQPPLQRLRAHPGTRSQPAQQN